MKKLTAFLETNRLMNPSQHDFRAHRSCLSQLLSHYELIITALESKKCYADVIYLDLSKAFDKVDHGILMKRVKKKNERFRRLSRVDSQFSLRQKTTS